MLPLEYISGFLDADGHIAIIQSGSLQAKRGIRKRVYFRLQVGFTNNHLEVLLRIQDSLGLGGSIQMVKRKAPHHRGYHLIYHAKPAEAVLHKLLPYLIVKRDRAQLAIEFSQRKESRGRYHNEDGTLRTMTDTDHYKDFEYRNRMVELNGRLRVNNTPELQTICLIRTTP